VAFRELSVREHREGVAGSPVRAWAGLSSWRGDGVTTRYRAHDTAKGRAREVCVNRLETVGLLSLARFILAARAAPR